MIVQNLLSRFPGMVEVKDRSRHTVTGSFIIGSTGLGYLDGSSREFVGGEESHPVTVQNDVQ